MILLIGMLNKIKVRTKGQRARAACPAAPGVVVEGKSRVASGFSLLEVLCVIGLLGVVTALTVPGLRQILQAARQEVVAQDLVRVMRYARYRAVARGLTVRLCFNPAQARYWLEQQAATADDGPQGVYAPVEGRLARGPLIAGSLRIEWPSGPLHFYRDGSMDLQRIYICKEAQCVTISTQEQKGRIHVFGGRVE